MSAAATPAGGTATVTNNANMYRVGDYVYFENSASGPYVIRRIEELNKTTNGESVLRKRSALSALGLQCILFWKYSLHMVCIQANMSAFWDFLDILRSYILYFPYFLVLCYFTCLSSSDYDRTCNMYL